MEDRLKEVDSSETVKVPRYFAATLHMAQHTDHFGRNLRIFACEKVFGFSRLALLHATDNAGGATMEARMILAQLPELFAVDAGMFARRPHDALIPVLDGDGDKSFNL